MTEDEKKAVQLALAMDDYRKLVCCLSDDQLIEEHWMLTTSSYSVSDPYLPVVLAEFTRRGLAVP